MKKPIFADLHKLTEDQRIALIAKTVKDTGQKVGFVVDDIPGKAERYIAKLRVLLPGIVIQGPVRGPAKGTMTVTASVPVRNN